MGRNLLLALGLFAGNLIYRSIRAGGVTTTAVVDSVASTVIAMGIWVLVGRLRAGRRQS